MATTNTNIAGDHTISVRRGDTFERTFNFDASVVGRTFKCEVRDMYDKKLILSFTPVVHDTTMVTISKTAIQMNVRAGRYVYDLADITGDGLDIDKVTGSFIIGDDVTANT